MTKVHNFSAGPGILPQSAIDSSVKALQNFAGMNLSILEISHRSKQYEAVVADATAIVKELLSVPAGYSVIFLQGGASTQFCMVPMNLLDENETAAYLKTGEWASRATKEAGLLFKGNVFLK